MLVEMFEEATITSLINIKMATNVNRVSNILPLEITKSLRKISMFSLDPGCNSVLDRINVPANYTSMQKVSGIRSQELSRFTRRGSRGTTSARTAIRRVTYSTRSSK